ncbi:hypothetical protein TetV_448 [Tetraselmis virus 1]|uniref:Uncharacterized protein n=1 Tax=Tetraselmis virus 1 TaxID=2060617 RepID=A0A2P0VNS6_9VIRU|nr:hypothetical protein QJ968_gp606 [Tetraselmis virus 1]AUF82530.1 hypothetical protein TetV_448 [Tetraselmis virus 1]
MVRNSKTSWVIFVVLILVTEPLVEGNRQKECDKAVKCYDKCDEKFNKKKFKACVVKCLVKIGSDNFNKSFKHCYKESKKVNKIYKCMSDEVKDHICYKWFN